MRPLSKELMGVCTAGRLAESLHLPMRDIARAMMPVCANHETTTGVRQRERSAWDLTNASTQGERSGIVQGCFAHCLVVKISRGHK